MVGLIGQLLSMLRQEVRREDGFALVIPGIVVLIIILILIFMACSGDGD